MARRRGEWENYSPAGWRCNRWWPRIGLTSSERIHFSEAMPQHYLHPLFNARSVAVFGASKRDDSVGGTLFRNLRNAGYSGEVYPVNPKHETVLGERCYAYAPLRSVRALVLRGVRLKVLFQVGERGGVLAQDESHFGEHR